MKRIIALCVLLSVPVVSAFAHPHVFITGSVKFLFSDDKLVGIQQNWRFDEIFSASLIADFDRSKDGVFSDAEITKIKEGAFSNLANYGYFSSLTIDGKKKTNFKIKDFSAVIDAGAVVYIFTIVLDIVPGGKAREVALTVYDDTYYVAVDSISAADITVEPPTARVDISLRKDPKEELYSGQAMPDQVVLNMGPE